jgi:L-ribulokinase
MPFSIGLDFGTESARALLVDVGTGETIATAVERYPDGVIDQSLPGSTRRLPPDWALQNPDDWLTTAAASVKAVLRESRIDRAHVIGVGVDFTSCTILPVRIDGTPLANIASFRGNPHAWPKLWKHHAAQPYADRVTALAAKRGERWLARYGGRISSEWLLPKALQIAEEAPDVYTAADHIVEGGDWIVWQMTGRLARNACAAGYKGLWHKQEGYPSHGYLADLNPALRELYSAKAGGAVVSPGQQVGLLTREWSDRLGLHAIPVAAAIIDAHAAALGAGVAGPGALVMMMGTSTCHLLMTDREEPVEGMAGVVEDGIVPGFFAYESGQAAVGDVFAWFVQHGVPAAYRDDASRANRPLHDLLAEKAGATRPGATGLIALDWWNGNRSTLMNAELSGAIIGLTLSTRPEDVYRALIEATAYGTRIIVESFTARELGVARIVAGGGLTQNTLLLQIYADVIGREIQVAGAEQASALGAAMLGAVAAGTGGGGYDSLSEAVAHMAPPPSQVFTPVSAHRDAYENLYAEYRRLYDYFGRSGNDVMKRLRHLRGQAPAI